MRMVVLVVIKMMVRVAGIVDQLRRSMYEL